MPEPISFANATEQFSFPYLFVGQAQKEFFVNQSLTLIDALLRGSVASSLSEPPSEAIDGDVHRVLEPAVGDWLGQDNKLALRVGRAWHFVAPFDGMQLFDQSAGQLLIFRSGWVSETAPAEVQGGNVVDVEARAAIADLSQSLRSLGILAPAA